MKLYQVGRAIVFGDQGVQFMPMKTFADRAQAEDFQRRTNELEAVLVTAENVQPFLRRLGITELHMTILEINVEEERRIHVPQLVMGKH